MCSRRLSLNLTAAALACAAMAGVQFSVEKAQAGKPAPPPPGIDNPAIAFLSATGGMEANSAIVLQSANGTRRFQLTTPPKKGGDHAPAWSPDGTKLAFLRRPDNSMSQLDLYTINANGTGLKLLTSTSYCPEHMQWSQCSQDEYYLIYGATVVAQTGASTPFHELLYDQAGHALPDQYVISNVSLGPDLDPAAGFQGYAAAEYVYLGSDARPVHRGLMVVEAEIRSDDAGVQVTLGQFDLLSLPVAPDFSPGYYYPVWSPDGGALAFVETTGSRGYRWEWGVSRFLDVVDVSIDQDTGAPSFGELATLCDDWLNQSDVNVRIYGVPSWSSDGNWVAFCALHTPDLAGWENLDIYRVPSEGSNVGAPMTNLNDKEAAVGVAWNPAWDPNGRP
jgi:hypothetical protein